MRAVGLGLGLLGICELALPGQGGVVVPELAAGVRGNDAFALPLRLHEGLMQVHLENGSGVTAIPNRMRGTSLRSLTFRKPHESWEPAYGSLSRSLDIRLLSCDLSSASLVADMGRNRSAAVAASPATSLTAVVQGQSFNIPATPPASPRQAVGADLLRIPFASPFPFAGPDLFLEFETTSSATVPSAQHWVDAIWGAKGDRGRFVELGHGGCGAPVSGGVPMHLMSTGAAPALGGSVQLKLRHARKDSRSLFMMGNHYPDLGRAPAGVRSWIQTMARMSHPDCRIWLQPLHEITGRTDAQGELQIAFSLPLGPAAAIGVPYNLQVAVYERDQDILEWSNGLAMVLGTMGLGNKAATVLAPFRNSRNSNGQLIPPIAPWPPMFNSAPVLQFSW